jgi:hypothetical protein
MQETLVKIFTYQQGVTFGHAESSSSPLQKPQISHPLRGFKKRVLQRIFGPRKDIIRGRERRLCTEYFENLISFAEY